MAESTLRDTDSVAKAASGLTARIAWRNLWRNKRRTWLTAGGIAFATLIVCFGMSAQVGTYGTMIENATRFLEGHLQISHPEYPDDTRLENTITSATELVRVLDAVPNIKVAPRAEAFALMSSDDRSFGGLLVGVDFEREQEIIVLFNGIKEGRLPQNEEEILLGATMARNLGARIGDEVVALGTAKEGGVAAMAQRVVGIYQSGQAEVDRTLMFVELPALQNAFALGDEVHKIVISGQDPQSLETEIAQVRRVVGNAGITRDWGVIMPEVRQAIQVDLIGGLLVFGTILILVSFSVINTFLMIVFERTREFGMLLAIGMRPGLIIRQVIAESFFVWVVGAGIGLSLSLLLVGWLSVSGIPVGDMGEFAETLYVSDRIYPALSMFGLLSAPLVLLVGTQIAGFIATLRIRRIRPVEALRGE
ncbi:MAG: FtsX-like permease family protein [Pseudomonadales bacterium]|nr:FtsX-like permease family protein [Pseudomonadales bacterium]